MAKKKSSASQPAAAASPSTPSYTTVYGDDGNPVDWWFIYKFSKESQTDSGVTVTGEEYAYFDSRMAADPKATLVKSPNLIDKESALSRTLNALFSAEGQANRKLGWYCYNDEDRHDSRGA
ncbi:MAG TPA: deoxyribonuclease II family protein, partial [Pirellulaceae bacterium]|nr:deoxyribonuclease II family protein [Pirellulaceae bacterium]